MRASHVAKRTDRMQRPVPLLVCPHRIAADQTGRRKGHQPRPLHPCRAAVHGQRRENRPDEHAEKRDTFHAAHARRDAILSAHVPHERIFRRRVERTLEPHQQHRSDDDRRRTKCESRDSDDDDRDLRPLGELDDPTLREDRRQAVRQRREENVGQDERAGRHPHEDRFQRRIGNPSDDDETRQGLQEVVVHRPEQVRHEQRNKGSLLHGLPSPSTRFRYSK